MIATYTTVVVTFTAIVTVLELLRRWWEKREQEIGAKRKRDLIDSVQNS